MPGLLLILFIGLVLVWAGAVVATAWMLTHPPRRTYASAVARGKAGDPSELDRPRRFESWSFRSRGMDFPVWEIAGDDPSGPTVVMTHGWADSRIGALARIAALGPVVSRIIAWDLPGHGEAPGVCALGMCEADDLLALWERCGAGSAIVLVGWSLGAGISIVAARKRDRGILGVIAESPYREAATPARNVLAARGLPHKATLGAALVLVRARYRGSPPTEPFDRAWHAARMPCPVLVLHGSEDEVCPVEDGRAIASAAARGRMEEIAGGHHNDLWTDAALAARCAAAVQTFIRELASPDRPAS